MAKAYVYLITYTPTGQMYIGSRKFDGDPSCDLFRNYFTSSKIVKQLIKQHSTKSFRSEILKTFESYPEAILYERNLQKELNAVEDDLYFNQSLAGERWYTKGPRTEETKEKIRKKLKGRANPRKGKPLNVVRSNEYRAKMSEIMKGKKNRLGSKGSGGRKGSGDRKGSTWKRMDTEQAYAWYNVNTSETFQGNRRELKKHDPSVGVPELKFVLDKKYKSHRGWTIL